MCACFSLFPIVPWKQRSLGKVGKRVNHGGGYGLEIPSRYHFFGPAKAIDWLQRKLKAVEKELECNVKKCLN